MNEKLTPEQKFALDDHEELIPRELAKGRSRDEIVSDLMRLDWTPSSARAAVDRLADEFQRYTESPESRAQLIAKEQKLRTLGIRGSVNGLVLAAMGYFFEISLLAYIGLLFIVLGLGGVLATRSQLLRYKRYSAALE